MKLFIILLYLTINSCQKLKKDNTKSINIINSNSAEINIEENKKIICLQNCSSEVEDKNLVIKLNNYPSESDFELLIIKEKDKYKIQYNQTFSVNDSSYKKPVFKIIKQKINFNKSEYKKGDVLRGNLKIDILANYRWEKNYFDTIKLSGSVQTIVK